MRHAWALPALEDETSDSLPRPSLTAAWRRHQHVGPHHFGDMPLLLLYAILCRLLLLLAVAGFLGAAGLLAWRAPGLAILVAVFLAWRQLRRWRGTSGAYGTSRLMTADERYDGGLVGGRDGVILCREGADRTDRPSRLPALRWLAFAPPWASALAVRRFLAAYVGGWRPGILRLATYVHLCTFAPTGRGKGVGVLVPNLLSFTRSCVVVDPKGELVRLTAAHRKRRRKSRIVVLDPFGVSGWPAPATFNLFDLLDGSSPHLIDQARALANAIVVRGEHSHEGRHFDDCAEIVLCAIIAYVAAHETRPHLRTFQTVRNILASRARYAQALDALQKSPACGAMLQRYGHLLTWHVDRELGSILSTVHRHTSFLDSPQVAACMAASSFDPRRLRSERMTVYLCLPPEYLVTLAPLMRLWVGCLLRAVAAGGASERNTVLFFLDESAHIGHIQILEDMVTLGRGFGIRLWFFFQSVGQLSACFGDRASVFLDNIDTQMWFGTNAMSSAQAISERMGDATVMSLSRQGGSSWSRPIGGRVGQDQGQNSGNAGWSVSEMGRRLLRPEEIIRLSEDMMIIFHRNWPPILGRLVKYFEAPEFRRGRVGHARRLGLGALAASLVGVVLSLAAVFFAGAVPVPVMGPPARPAMQADPSAWEGFPPVPPELSDAWLPAAERHWQAWLREGKALVSRLADLLPARPPEAGEASPVPSREEQSPWHATTMKASFRRSPTASAR